MCKSTEEEKRGKKELFGLSGKYLIAIFQSLVAHWRLMSSYCHLYFSMNPLQIIECSQCENACKKAMDQCFHIKFCQKMEKSTVEIIGISVRD